MNIPEHLHKRLRDVLSRCDKFESDDELKTVFVTQTLSLWSSSLPEANNKDSRVDGVIKYLVDKRRSSDGKNALVLLLLQLSDLIDRGDELHQSLADLALDLENAVGGNSSSIPEPPTAKLGFSLKATVFKLMPFDLGTIWGLQRSSFIGLLAGFDNDGIYENLLSVEFTLAEAIKKSKFLIPIQKREWRKIELNQDLNTLQNPVQVLAGFISNENNQALNPSLLGIFFDINSKQLDNGLYEQIFKLCDIILNELFSSRQTAIIIHVNCEVGENQVILNLEKKLKNINDIIPIDVMCLERPKSHFNPILSNHHIHNNAFLQLKSKKVGLSLCSWIHFIATHSYKKNEIDTNKYQNLIDVYKNLINIFSEEEIISSYKDVSAADVINDIANISSDMNSSVIIECKNIYSLLLQFVIEYLPQRSYEFISTYVRTVNQKARSEGLIIVANSELFSDLFFDAWINGIKDSINCINNSTVFDTANYSTSNPILEGLTLAFLRRYQNNSYEDSEKIEIESTIRKWMTYLPISLKRVCKLYLEKTREDYFIDNYGANEFTLAIRAKAKFKQAFNSFKGCKITRPALWWLLAAMPPSSDSIIEMLKLDKKKRAVFGLCTIEEWQQIQEDEENECQILDCRRKRQLIYRRGN